MTATILWEITRSILVWYYAHLSLVNLIYGSIATVVVALLSVEAVALIILLGAQVIAELERKTDELTGERLSGFAP
jgi:membrane protein